MKKGEHRTELLEAMKLIQMSERVVLGVVEDLDDKVTATAEDSAKTAKALDAVINGLSNIKGMMDELRKTVSDFEKRVSLLEEVLTKEYPSSPK